MRKLLYIFVALVAFAVGILGYYVRPKFMPAPLYEITQNINLYKRQRIHIKAYLEARRFNLKNSDDNSSHSEIYSDLFDYKKFCVKDCIEGASLNLPENIENNEILNLTNEIADKNSQIGIDDGLYFVEVEITGEIEQINACFAPPYIVKVENIKQISPIQFISHSELDKIIGRK